MVHRPNSLIAGGIGLLSFFGSLIAIERFGLPFVHTAPDTSDRLSLALSVAAVIGGTVSAAMFRVRTVGGLPVATATDGGYTPDSVASTEQPGSSQSVEVQAGEDSIGSPSESWPSDEGGTPRKSTTLAEKSRAFAVSAAVVASVVTVAVVLVAMVNRDGPAQAKAGDCLDESFTSIVDCGSNRADWAVVFVVDGVDEKADRQVACDGGPRWTWNRYLAENHSLKCMFGLKLAGTLVGDCVTDESDGYRRVDCSDLGAVWRVVYLRAHAGTETGPATFALCDEGPPHRLAHFSPAAQALHCVMPVVGYKAAKDDCLESKERNYRLVECDDKAATWQVLAIVSSVPEAQSEEYYTSICNQNVEGWTSYLRWNIIDVLYCMRSL